MNKIFTGCFLIILCSFIGLAQTVTSFYTGATYPFALAITKAGDTLYHSGQGGGEVEKIVAGTLSTVTTSSGMYAIVLDRSERFAYVGNKNKGVDKVVLPEGTVTNIVANSLIKPRGMALDPAGANLYIANDQSPYTIEKVALPGGTRTTFVPSTTTPALNRPYAIAIDSTNTYLYVASIINNNILKVSVSDGSVSEFISATNTPAITNPSGMAMDATCSNLYVTTYAGDIYRVTIPGGVVTLLASSTSVTGMGSFNGIAMDGAGNLYAGNLMTGEIFKITTGPTAVRGDEPLLIERYSLGQNYPNPFNPSTMIEYQLPHRSIVTLKVYSLLGTEIATLVNGVQEAGVQTIPFRADGLPSGVYVYQLQAGTYMQTKFMTVVK